MFKTIALVAALTVTSLVSAGTITCGKTKRKNKTSYPIDTAAITLMSKLGVKTCTRSRRVRKYLKTNKITVKTVIVTQTTIDNSRDKLDEL